MEFQYLRLPISEIVGVVDLGDLNRQRQVCETLSETLGARTGIGDQSYLLDIGDEQSEKLDRALEIGPFQDTGDVRCGESVLGRVGIHTAEHERQRLTDVVRCHKCACVVVEDDDQGGVVFLDLPSRSCGDLSLPLITGMPFRVQVEGLETHPFALQDLFRTAGLLGVPRVLGVIAEDEKDPCLALGGCAKSNRQNQPDKQKECFPDSISSHSGTSLTCTKHTPTWSETKMTSLQGLGRGRGNREVHKHLFRATLSDARHNPSIQSIYRHLKNQGKPDTIGRITAARRFLLITAHKEPRRNSREPASSLACLSCR